jgi:AcrR family transcriptional regulator
MAKVLKLEKLKDRAERRAVSREDARRELAMHAVDTLAQLGYARTGMRDIAQRSGRSLGSLTYYFADKADLICHCVLLYKEQFVINIDAAVVQGQAQDDVIGQVAQAFSDAVTFDAEKHRLWYDIRNQAMFEHHFREIVRQIEANLMALILRIMLGIDAPPSKTMAAYLMLDGAFRMALQAHANGVETAAAELGAQVVEILNGFSADRCRAL